METIILLILKYGIILIGLMVIAINAKSQSTTSGDTRSGWGINVGIGNIAVADSGVIMTVSRATDSITSLKATVSTKMATAAFTALAITTLYGYIPANPSSIPTNNNQISNGAGYISSVPAQTFASLTGKPTTLSGYGITDGVSTSRTISTTSPITGGGDLSANRTIAINNGAADGSTKGAVSMNADYFDDNGSGNISWAVTNGTGSVSASAVTINTPKGKITYTSPSITAGTAIAVTFTNSFITSTSIINIGLNGNGSNLTGVNAYVKSQTAGSCVINIQNLSLLNLFNSTFIIDYFIVN